jgi:hypothetical protein
MPRVFQDDRASYNPAIVIHQIQIKCDFAADRLPGAGSHARRRGVCDLADAARQRRPPNADFTRSFKGDGAHQPLLATEIELQVDAQGGLRMKVSESQGRQLTLHFNDELHAALSRLFEQALAAADWGLPPPTPAAPDPAPPLMN